MSLRKCIKRHRQDKTGKRERGEVGARIRQVASSEECREECGDKELCTEP